MADMPTTTATTTPEVPSSTQTAATPAPAPATNAWAELEKQGITPEKASQWGNQLRGYQALTEGRTKTLKEMVDAGVTPEQFDQIVRIGRKALDSGLDLRPDPKPESTAAGGLSPDQVQQMIADAIKNYGQSASMAAESATIASTAQSVGFDANSDDWPIIKSIIDHNLDKLTGSGESLVPATADQIKQAVEATQKFLSKRDAATGATLQQVQTNNPTGGYAGPGATPTTDQPRWYQLDDDDPKRMALLEQEFQAAAAGRGA